MWFLSSCMEMKLLGRWIDCSSLHRSKWEGKKKWLIRELTPVSQKFGWFRKKIPIFSKTLVLVSYNRMIKSHFMSLPTILCDIDYVYLGQNNSQKIRKIIKIKNYFWPLGGAKMKFRWFCVVSWVKFSQKQEVSSTWRSPFRLKHSLATLKTLFYYMSDQVTKWE